jgi:hypothetical protein
LEDGEPAAGYLLATIGTEALMLVHGGDDRNIFLALQ